MDDLDRLFGTAPPTTASNTQEADTPPAPADTPPPAPEQPPAQATAQPIAQPDDLDRLFGGGTPTSKPQAPSAPANDARSSGFFAGAARGFVSGVGGMPADEARGVQTLLQLGQVLTPGSEADKRFDYLTTLRPGENWQPKVSSYTDIHSVSDALTYAGEGAGNMAGSMAGFFAHRLAGGVAGGVVGGALGSETGPGAVITAAGGSAVGAAAAGAMGIFAQSVGQTRDSIMDEPKVKEAIADGTVNYNVVNAAAAVAGLGMTAIEYPQMMRMGIGAGVTKEGLQEVVKQSFIKTALKEGAKVSMEEMAQQAIQEVGQYVASGDPALARRTEDVINNGLQSFLPGFVAGGAHHLQGGAHADQSSEVPPPTDKGQANPTEPEGTSAGADHLGANQGTATPGGTGTPAAPPPATVDAAKSTTEKTTVPEGQTDTQTSDQTQGHVDVDQAAAMAQHEEEHDEDTNEINTAEGQTDTGGTAQATGIPARPAVDDAQQAALNALASSSDQSPSGGRGNTVDQIIAAGHKAAADAVTAAQQKRREETTPQIGAPTGENTPAVELPPTPTEPLQETPPVQEGAAVPPLEPAPTQPAVAAVPEHAPIEGDRQGEQQLAETRPEDQLAPAEPEALAGSAVEGTPPLVSTPEEGASSSHDEITLDDLKPDHFDQAIEANVAPQSNIRESGIPQRDRTRDVRGLIEPEAINSARKVLAGEHDTEAVNRAVNQAFAEHADEINSRQHASVSDAVKALRAPILDRAKELAVQYAGENRTEAATREAEKIQQGVTKSRQLNEDRLREGTNQEKERAGSIKGKSAEGILNEDERSWQRRAAAGTDARSQRITELYNKLGKLKGGNQRASFVVKERAAIRDKLDAMRQEDMDQARAQLEANPKPTQEAQAAAQAAATEATKQNLQRTPEEREAARQQAEDAKYAAANAEHTAKTKAVLAAHPEPSEAVLRKKSGADQEKAISDRVFSIVKNLQDKLGLKTLPQKLNLANSRAVNYLIQAKRIMRDDTQLSKDRLYDLAGLTAEFEHSPSDREFYHQIDKAEKDYNFNRIYDDNAAAMEKEPDSLDADANVLGEGGILGNESLDDFVKREQDMQKSMVSKGRTVEATDTGLRNRLGDEIGVKPEDTFNLGDILDHLDGQVPDKTARWATWTRRNVGPDSVHDFLRRFLDKRFKQQLSNVPVYIVDHDPMQKFMESPSNAYARGGWIEPSAAARAQGAKGAIVLNRRTLQAGNPGEAAAVLRHEAAHGLTVYALDHNIDNAKTIISNMMATLKGDLIKEGRDHVFNDPSHQEFQYGLSTPYEFVAEAFNNPGFQEFLASREISPGLMRTLGDHKLVGRTKQTYWDLFLHAVSRALRLTGFGGNGMSYLEQTLRLSEPSLRSGNYTQSHAIDYSREHPNAALYNRSGVDIRNPGGQWAPTGPEHMDPEQHIFGSSQVATAAVNAYQTARDMAQNPGIGAYLRRHLNSIQTMPQIAQNMDRYFGRDKNPFHQIADYVRNRGVLARDMMQEGDRIITQYGALPRHMSDQLSALVHDATLHNVDPSQGLTGPNNRWVGKGVLNASTRANHARLQLDYAKLSPEAKALFKQTGDFYKRMQDQMSRQTASTMLTEGEQAGALGTRPPGKTMQDQLDFIMNGGIERAERPISTQASQAEIDAHRADNAMLDSLGNLKSTFQQATSLRATKGFYSPLMRRGNFYVAGKLKMNVPAGAARWNDSQFIFRDKAKFEAWAKTNEDHLARKPQSIWMKKDPATGKWERTTRDDISFTADNKMIEPVQHFLVSPQLEHYERFGSESEAKARSKQMKEDPTFESSTDAAYPRDFHRVGDFDILPTSARKLVEDATKYMSGPTKDAVIRNLSAAIMQHNAGTRIQQRQRKRRGVFGYSRDAVRAMGDYNVSASNQIARLMTRPGINEARRTIENDITQRTNRGYSNDNSTRLVQEAYQAIGDQLKTNETFDPSTPGSRWIHTGLALSFLNHLASPANWVVNSLQGGMVTLPYLAARHGGWRAVQAMGKATRVIGAGQQLKIGGQNMMHPLRPRETVKPMVQRLQRAGMGQEAEVIKRLQDIGLIGHDAGFELEASEIRKNMAERFLSRASAVASAVPIAMENINRAQAGLAAYWLKKQDGGTHEQGINAAKDAVNDTHGDYSGSIAPTMFRSPMAKLMLQFKKYPQMMMRLILKSATDSFKGATPLERSQARKQLIGLTLSHLAIAGAGGVPFTEGLKMLALLSHGIGGGDDYQGWENWVQGFLAKFMGDKMSELTMRGLPRAAGIDLSGRMGLDSLLFFGSPQDDRGALKANNVKAWALDTLAGAPLGVATSILSGISNMVQGTGNSNQGISQMPIPKVLNDIWKASQQYAGPNKKPSGVADPGSQLNFREAVWKALGFQPARIAERYEYGGPKYADQQKAQGMQDRQAQMQKWLNATPGAGRQQAMQGIRQWNQGQPVKNRITIEGLQKADVKRKAQAATAAKAEPM